MQRVISRELWQTARRFAKTAVRRKAAISYVTRDLVGFKAGDVLVVDASRRSIACGETSATVLQDLYRRGVHIHSCPDLHAKVFLLDRVAIVASANMSESSRQALIEAGVVTDAATVVSGVASFIEQLVSVAPRLTEIQIQRLCSIPVVRRRGRVRRRTRRMPRPRRLGDQTWLVGVRELARDPVPEEQKAIDRAQAKVKHRLRDPDEESTWIRWTGNTRLVRECREGDTMIQIWRSARAKRPSAVFRMAPVLLKQRTKRWTRFYLDEPVGSGAELTWGRFKRLLKDSGYLGQSKPGMVRLLEPGIAATVAQRWRSAARGSKK